MVRSGAPTNRRPSAKLGHPGFIPSRVSAVTASGWLGPGLGPGLGCQNAHGPPALHAGPPPTLPPPPTPLPPPPLHVAWASSEQGWLPVPSSSLPGEPAGSMACVTSEVTQLLPLPDSGERHSRLLFMRGVERVCRIPLPEGV